MDTSGIMIHRKTTLVILLLTHSKVVVITPNRTAATQDADYTFLATGRKDRETPLGRSLYAAHGLRQPV